VTEDLFQLIAQKHGIALGPDDPILIVHTLHQRLLQESAAAQQELLHQFRDELDALAHRWAEDANARAERMLTAALAVTREAMAKTMEQGTAAAALALRRELDAAAAHSQLRLRTARHLAFLSLTAAALAFTAALVLLARMS
jgi:hypothetical protein